MIIYGSQVASLCGPRRLREPRFFGKTIPDGKQDKETLDWGEMYADADFCLMTLLLLSQFRVITFSRPPAESRLRRGATNIDRRLRLVIRLLKSVFRFAYKPPRLVC